MITSRFRRSRRLALRTARLLVMLTVSKCQKKLIANLFLIRFFEENLDIVNLLRKFLYETHHINVGFILELKTSFESTKSRRN